MSHLFSKHFFYTLAYFNKPPWDTGISPPELFRFIEENPPGRALDLGCGTGTNAITLARNGWQVTGVDFVDYAIRNARRKAKQAEVNINFINKDVSKYLELNQRIDLVLDIGCFHTLPKKKKIAYTRNVIKMLAPTGTYLLYAWLSLNTDQSHGFNQEDLQSWQQELELIRREDGTERGIRPATWFTFKKQS